MNGATGQSPGVQTSTHNPSNRTSDGRRQEEKEMTIDKDYVREKLSEILEDVNLSRYIL